MSCAFSVERAVLYRHNPDLNKQTIRKSYEVYRFGEAALLLEIWGFNRGKGFAQFCRSRYELEQKIARFVEREKFEAFESEEHRLTFDTPGFTSYDDYQDFAQHIYTSVNKDASMAVAKFKDALTRAGAFDKIPESPTYSFKDLWKLKEWTQPAVAEDENTELPDLDVVVPPSKAAYESWGDFA